MCECVYVCVCTGITKYNLTNYARSATNDIHLRRNGRVRSASTLTLTDRRIEFYDATNIINRILSICTVMFIMFVLL